MSCDGTLKQFAFGSVVAVIATPDQVPGGSNPGEPLVFSGLLRRCAPRNDNSVRAHLALTK